MDEHDLSNYAQRVGHALRRIRQARALTQEDFSLVSSRTYMSALERGLQSPTLEKLLELAKVLKIHPATVLVLADAWVTGQSSEHDLADLLQRISDECAEIQRRLQLGP